MTNDPALKRAFDRAREQFEERAARRKEAVKKEMEANAEHQRRKAMTRDERTADAIDRTAKGIREYNDFKQGRDTTSEEAYKKARELAHISERNKA